MGSGYGRILLPAIRDLRRVEGEYVTLGIAFDAFNNSAVSFLKIELGLAHTFLDLAESTRQQERRTRNVQNALEAYCTLLRFLPRLRISDVESLTLGRELCILKDRLVSGEVETN